MNKLMADTVLSKDTDSIMGEDGRLFLSLVNVPTLETKLVPFENQSVSREQQLSQR